MPLDWKTGDSLQYAFIEFETTEMVCAENTLRMRNAAPLLSAAVALHKFEFQQQTALLVRSKI